MFSRVHLGSRVLGALLVLGTIALPSRGLGRPPGPAAAKPAADAEAPGPATFAGCSDAPIRVVRFGTDVTIDEIRVHLLEAAGEDPPAPVIVKVATGRFARRLLAASAGRASLSFSPGLRGHRFEISLDAGGDGEDAPRACAARIELVAGDRVVASITP